MREDHKDNCELFWEGKICKNLCFRRNKQKLTWLKLRRPSHNLHANEVQCKGWVFNAHTLPSIPIIEQQQYQYKGSFLWNFRDNPWVYGIDWMQSGT